MATTQEQLAEVQAAITRLLADQAGIVEHGAGTEKYRGVELDQLTAREEVLLDRLAAEQSAGGMALFSPLDGGR